MKIVIVGGGVIGSSIAYHLQGAGASVVLLERGEIGGEASGAAAGMLIPPIEDISDDTFNELRRASLAMYPELVGRVQDASGIDVEYKVSGMLRTATKPETAAWLRQVADEQEGLRWLDADDLRLMEPALSEDVIGAAGSDDDADLNPELWTKALARAAETLGAEVRTGVTVQEVLDRGVSTDQGFIQCDATVVAAGAWAGGLTSIDTPPKRGQMISFRSEPVKHAVWGEYGYLVPKPGGFLWAGATVEDSGFDKQATEGGVDGLRSMAARLVPGLEGAEVARAWAGLRPGSPDGMPVIGRLPERENAYVATGHFRNGILLAPITGALVAELVLEGLMDERMVPFGPERFNRRV